MLLDIDTKIGISTLHDLRCGTATTAHSTATKPFGRLGADGGWFPVVDRAHAMEKLATWSPGFALAGCPMCLTSKATDTEGITEP